MLVEENKVVEEMMRKRLKMRMRFVKMRWTRTRFKAQMKNVVMKRWLENQIKVFQIQSC